MVLSEKLRMEETVRHFAFAVATVIAVAATSQTARADMFGAGTGFVVAGPIGAVAGGVVGAALGKPFFGVANRPRSMLDRQ